MENKEVSQQVEIAKRESEKLSEKVYAIKIRTESDLNTATSFLGEVKKFRSSLEAKRKSFTQPLNAVIRDINAMFKDPDDRLKDAENLIKREMLHFQQMLEKRAAKKAEKIENQVDAGEMGLADGVAKLSNIKQAPSGVSIGGATAQFRTVKKVRIADLSQIPAYYFMRESVQEAILAEINKDVRLGKELPSGAEFYEDRQVAMKVSL